MLHRPFVLTAEIDSSLSIAMQILRRLSLLKGLLNLSSRGTMRQAGEANYPSTAFQQTIKTRFLSPVTRVFRKRFLTTCLTTDSRGVCGNSGVKSCEEHSQQSKSGYKASEKIEKFLFKSLGARCREFESPISDQQKQVVLSKTTCFCNFLPYLPHHYLPSTLTISPDYLSQEDSFFNVERAA